MAKYKQQLMKFTDKEEKLIVDIHVKAIVKMSNHLQLSYLSKEAGGVLLGYMEKATSTINITDVTEPQHDDYQNRIRFIRKSYQHVLAVQQASEDNNFYIGNWHTHPQDVPIPSLIDNKTWKKGLLEDRVPFEQQIYIICGTSEIRVWIGDEKNGDIIELFEVKAVNELYLSRGENRNEPD